MGDPYIKQVLSGSHDWPRMPGCTSPFSEPTPRCNVYTCLHLFPRNRFIDIPYLVQRLNCAESPLCCFQHPTHRLSFVAGLRGASSVCGLGFPARRCEQQRENQDTLSHATQIWRTLTCGWELWMDQVRTKFQICPNCDGTAGLFCSLLGSLGSELGGQGICTIHEAIWCNKSRMVTSGLGQTRRIYPTNCSSHEYSWI